jgi:Flp pilus assembly protein TadB
MSPLPRLLAQFGVRILQALGMTERRQLQEQLRILDRTVERHAYEKMLASLAGLLLPLLFGFVLAQIGSPFPPSVFVLTALGLAVGGFLYPDLTLSDQVAERQSAFRHALAGYLDLVSIILAGGGGVESALVGAAESGDGWVFAELRAALRRGELTGRPPWEMFEEVGVRFGITELQELAASMALAGGHGARVRQSLIAKAEALRALQGAEMETKAEAATEKMVVPVTVMVLGLMIFIGYGAMVVVMSSGTTG